jgi:hypothetical protein
MKTEGTARWRRATPVVAGTLAVLSLCQAAGAGEVRLNQVGYLPGDAKIATLMSRAASLPADTRFAVEDVDGKTVLKGRIGKAGAGWNERFVSTYQLDFSGLTEPGRYRLRVAGTDPSVSPAFRIGDGVALYGPLVDNAIAFYRAQRDGTDVDPEILDRKPSHLADAQAKAFAPLRYKGYRLVAKPEAVGGRRDVSGGWFDAGDYLKFVATASFVDTALYLAVRDRGPWPRLLDEAAFGSDWLMKMWDDETRTLFYQVGLGDGGVGLVGDHDLWRLPEADDELTVKPGDAAYFVKFRPALRAGPPGSPVSPNLAGRLAAAFALCATVGRAADRPRCAAAAEHIYSLADRKPKALLAASPHDYYPEDNFADDLELGAVELHFLAKAGGTEKSADFYLREAARWARVHIKGGSSTWQTLDLFDVGPLAHLELMRALEAEGDPRDLAVTRADLKRDVEDQLKRAERQAATDPFRSGWAYAPKGWDHVQHLVGLTVTALLFDEEAGKQRFAVLAKDQRDWLLGRNAWGTSFVVGAGTTFPRCLHHQVANLSGNLAGKSPLLLGAVVAGPGDAAEVEVSEPSDEQRRCPAGGKNPFRNYDGAKVRYVDDATSWSTSEPAIDYVALTVILFSMMAQ